MPFNALALYFRVVFKLPTLVTSNITFQKILIIFHRFQKIKAAFPPMVFFVLAKDFLESFSNRSFSSSIYRSKNLMSNVLKFNRSSIILFVNRWFERTKSQKYVDIFISACSWKPFVAYFIFRRFSSLWKYLKPPKNLGSWQNTVFVGLLKFCKSFCCAVPKSEAKSNSTPVLVINIAHF